MKRLRSEARVPAEEQIHSAVVDLLRVKADPRTIFYHVPNSLPSSKRSVHRFVTKLGMRPGVADLCLVLPDGRAAFLEIKAENGSQSLAQRAFQMHADFNGAPYAIARTLMEADEILAGWGAYRVRSVRSAA